MSAPLPLDEWEAKCGEWETTPGGTCGETRPGTLGHQRCWLPTHHEGHLHKSQDGKRWGDEKPDPAAHEDDHWAACSEREFGPIGAQRHLVRKGAMTTVCGATATHPDIWRGNSTKPCCSECLIRYGKDEQR